MAVCIDRYAPEMLKSLRRILRPILPSVPNRFMSEQKLPNLLLKNLFIFKHNGDNNNHLENFRTIAINYRFAKVICKIIYNKFLGHVERKRLLPSLQFGFCKAKSTMSAIFTFKKLISDRFANKKKTFACFID